MTPQSSRRYTAVIVRKTYRSPCSSFAPSAPHFANQISFSPSIHPSTQWLFAFPPTFHFSAVLYPPSIPKFFRRMCFYLFIPSPSLLLPWIQLSLHFVLIFSHSIANLRIYPSLPQGTLFYQFNRNRNQHNFVVALCNITGPLNCVLWIFSMNIAVCENTPTQSFGDRALGGSLTQRTEEHVLFYSESIYSLLWFPRPLKSNIAAAASRTTMN